MYVSRCDVTINMYRYEMECRQCPQFRDELSSILTSQWIGEKFDIEFSIRWKYSFLFLLAFWVPVSCSYWSELIVFTAAMRDITVLEIASARGRNWFSNALWSPFKSQTVHLKQDMILIHINSLRHNKMTKKLKYFFRQSEMIFWGRDIRPRNPTTG